MNPFRRHLEAVDALPMSPFNRGTVMAWFADNWFFALLLVAFVGMHMFGHGHGGQHSRERGHSHDPTTPPSDEPPSHDH